MPSNLLKDNYPEIFSQIDIERTNKEFPSINIDSLTKGTNTKVYFKCPNCGKSYLTSIKNRTVKHSGCNLCRYERASSKISASMSKSKLKDTNRDIWESIDKQDFALKYPHINIDDISTNSNYKVKFICSTCGKSWEAYICNRILHNTQYPYCTGHKIVSGINDFRTLYPEIFSQINQEETKKIYPNIDFYCLPPSSNYSVVWHCNTCNQNYRCRIADKVCKHYQCPICSNKKIVAGINDLESFCKNNPEYKFILDSWNYEKNIILPSELAPHSNKKIWWRCSKGHSWKSSPNDRISDKTKCPNAQTKYLYLKKLYILLF